MSAEKSRKPTAIVVGCGVGGIATAARLAQAGFDVQIFEKNDYSGGRCSLIEQDGYRFDQGPSLLLLPDLFKQTFEDLGERMEDHLDLIKCEPNYKVHFHDDETFTLSTDLTTLKKEVERFEGKDGFSGFLSFLQEAHEHYEQAIIHVLQKNFPQIICALRPSFLREVLRLHPFESIWTRVSRHFKTERLRRVFSFATMYMGMSPYDAPGTYSLLQYTELTEGIWYPRGGFWQVPSALLKILNEKFPDTQTHFNAPVSKVLLSPSRDRAIGVRLESGKEFHADVVIVNADLVYAAENLLDDGEKGVKRNKALEKAAGELKGSCSSISLYWGMSKKLSGLCGHNIFLAEDYLGSFDDIFKKHGLPNDLSIYVHCPSELDPTCAPEGKETLTVLVPCGHIDSQNPQDWDEYTSRARRLVIEMLSRKCDEPDFESLIVSEKIHNAETWQKEFNLSNGSILGLAHNFLQVLGFRPTTAHPNINKLFFVGASTHPGTGVPIVLAGAKLTSTQVMEDFGIRPPPPGPSTMVSTSDPYGSRKHADSPLDRFRPLLFWDLERYVLAVLLIVLSLVFYKVLNALGAQRWL